MAFSLPNIINHISIGTNDLEKSARFYDAVMPTIGAKRQHEIAGTTIAYGKMWPEFWIGLPLNGNPATSGNGSHIAVTAASPEGVDEFYRAALSAGGRDAGKPGLRPQYGPTYYAAFIYDPDGHKIEVSIIPQD